MTPETIDSVTRVYRSTTGSTRVALRDVELPEKTTLVRMINSQNNERLFFADKVVLVEGISDRLIFESLLDSAATLFHISAAVEVVEVGGKHNFSDYEVILKGMRTPVFTIADRDYLMQVGSEEASALFTNNASKEWKALIDKKSADRSTLISELGAAIASADTDSLRLFWDYLRARHKKLKDPLSVDDQQTLEAEYQRLGTHNIIILHRDEIENYLPAGGRDVRGIVELIRDPNWVTQVPSEDARAELAQIIAEILGVPIAPRQALVESFKTGNAAFKPLGAA